MVQINLSEREQEILKLLSQESTISIADMSSALKVSAVTIRNDLNNLADKGFILRTRGGALPAFHPNLVERQRLMLEEKNSIARFAASLVKEGDAIMIEAGTTTALIVKYLFGKRDVHIVTNSTLIIPYARVNPAIRLTLVGGDFRPETESMVGPVALNQLERFHVRVAFVGTDGFSIERGLTTHLIEGAEIVKKMAKQASETVLVADSSKFGKAGFVHVLPITGVNRIITDKGLKQEHIDVLVDQGIDTVSV